MRLLTALTCMALAPLSAAFAQVTPPKCNPCNVPGACPATEPIVSGSVHKCENHAFHDHSGLAVSNVDMTKMKIASGSLANAQLTTCLLEGMNAYALAGSGLTLAGCDADGMVGMDADLAGASFTATTLVGAYMPRADLSAAVIPADFSGANLAQATFDGAVLSVGADLANFSDADLSGAKGLANTVGTARYSVCTIFAGTGFDPVAAGWELVAAPAIGDRYCDPAVPNSSGLPAVVTAYGCTHVTANNVWLEGVQLPPNKFGYFLTSQTQDLVIGPGGSQGNLCLGGTIGRYSKQVLNSGSGGVITMPVDLGAMPPPTKGVVAPGETWNFQAWFRDANPMPTSNFTDAVAVTFD